MIKQTTVIICSITTVSSAKVKFAELLCDPVPTTASRPWWCSVYERSFSFDVAYLYDEDNLVTKAVKVISAASAQLLNDCLMVEA